MLAGKKSGFNPNLSIGDPLGQQSRIHTVEQMKHEFAENQAAVMRAALDGISVCPEVHDSGANPAGSWVGLLEIGRRIVTISDNLAC